MAEVKLKRFAGPFASIPFNNYVQPPVGLVEKREPGQTRLIFNPSHVGNMSVNHCMPKDLCTVKYCDLDHTVRLCMRAGINCFAAKADMKSAFRNLPIRKEDWCWLVMMARHPTTGDKWFFVDKCHHLEVELVAAIFNECQMA